MSRANRSDNSTDVSLFPFLAVLLCTMGSLLLVLVVMAKVSREKAAARAVAEDRAQQADVLDQDDGQSLALLEMLGNRKSHLDQRRQEAQALLRKEQLRLRHIEDHMRRLQDQLQSLQLAAAELIAMEEEKLDDRMTAAREVTRLQKLIDETRRDIDELRKENGGPRSFALVPYQGPNETRRPPIYIECRKNLVVLQPEGIQLTPDDFAPPLGAGNPLASALRTVREFMIRQNPALGKSADTEPYPLIVVRPDGVEMYYKVRAAIESWDSDFGYELVESEMQLEFPDPNPELATLEYRTIELARGRQRMLAAAAPRAYATTGGAGAGYMGDDDDFGAGGGFGSDGSFGGDFGDSVGGTGESGTDGQGTPGGQFSGQPGGGAGQFAGGEFAGGPGGSEPYGRDLESGDGAGQDGFGERQSPGGPELGPAGNPGIPGSPSQQAGTQQAGSTFEQLGSLQQPSGRDANSTAGGAMGGPNGESSASGSGGAGSGMSGGGPSGGAGSVSIGGGGGGSGAGGGGGPRFGPKRPDDVAIRRTVQIVVRKDRLSILPDREETPQDGNMLAGGKEIPVEGDTQFAVDKFVSALQEHIHNWGIAGNGLYWRPVLTLNVGPDGQQRADELASFLRRSGLDVRTAATAQRQDQTDANQTR